MSEGTDREHFQIGIQLGIGAAVEMIRQGKSLAQIVAYANSLPDPLRVRPAAVDGDAEYQSWFLTAGDLEVASWIADV